MSREVVAPSEPITRATVTLKAKLLRQLSTVGSIALAAPIKPKKPTKKIPRIIRGVFLFIDYWQALPLNLQEMFGVYNGY